MGALGKSLRSRDKIGKLGGSLFLASFLLFLFFYFWGCLKNSAFFLRLLDWDVSIHFESCCNIRATKFPVSRRDSCTRENCNGGVSMPGTVRGKTCNAMFCFRLLYDVRSSFARNPMMEWVFPAVQLSISPRIVSSLPGLGKPALFIGFCSLKAFSYVRLNIELGQYSLS